VAERRLFWQKNKPYRQREMQKKLVSAATIEFFLTRDASLGFVPDKTIDAIWSFDVFQSP
jgi:hypothetical protein